MQDPVEHPGLGADRLRLVFGRGVWFEVRFEVGFWVSVYLGAVEEPLSRLLETLAA